MNFSKNTVEQIQSSDALLIVNLGSPDSPSTSDVRKYLQEFLMDPYVIDIPKFWRSLLVYGPISIFRAKKSADAYKHIWDDKRGSPLIYHTIDFVRGLKALLNSNLKIEMAMRYANPSIENSLKKLLTSSSTKKLCIALMYPQFALSSTETARVECERVLKDLNFKGEVKYLQDFHSEPEFIEAFSHSAKKILPSSYDDKTLVLMSFHGIPERHIKKLDSYNSDFCLSSNGHCCDQLNENNKNCYRAQCYSTARLLAKSIGLASNQYRVSFQSRLGRTPWIKPYTDFVLKDLAAEGFKTIYVMCPAFVTDCLETLEEIQIRESEAFKSYGGEALHLIPCPNASKEWIEAFKNMYLRMGSSKSMF